MTNRELINKLIDYPPEAEVAVNNIRVIGVQFGLTHRDKPKGNVEHIPTVFIEAYSLSEDVPRTIAKGRKK